MSTFEIKKVSARYKNAPAPTGDILDKWAEMIQPLQTKEIVSSQPDTINQEHNLANETRKGLKETALEALHTGGFPPFGYDAVRYLLMLFLISEKE